MSNFNIPQNGPYFAATLETLTSRQIGELMVTAQRNLDTATGKAHREVLRELVRECAAEYHSREYPASATH